MWLLCWLLAIYLGGAWVLGLDLCFAINYAWYFNYFVDCFWVFMHHLDSGLRWNFGLVAACWLVM